MTTPLSPTALSKGDFITVLEWTSHQDNSYKGDVLEVQAIDLPFIICKRHWDKYGGKGDEKPLSLNTNAVQLVSLSKEYVDAALGRKTVVAPPESPIKVNTYVKHNARGIHLVDCIVGRHYKTALEPNTSWLLSSATPATNDEIKAHLIAEAEKRGIRVGTKVIRAHSEGTYAYPISEMVLIITADQFCSSIVVHDYAKKVNRPFLAARGDSFSNPVDEIEVVKESLSITVEGKAYTPTFKEGYVEFGCAKIPNEAFIAAHAICMIPQGAGNRFVTHVKIGKGEFSPALLGGLAEEIARREAEKDDGYDYYVHANGEAFNEGPHVPFNEGQQVRWYIRWNRVANRGQQVFINPSKVKDGCWDGPSHTWLKVTRAEAEALLRKATP